MFSEDTSDEPADGTVGKLTYTCTVSQPRYIVSFNKALPKYSKNHLETLDGSKVCDSKHQLSMTVGSGG